MTKTKRCLAARATHEVSTREIFVAARSDRAVAACLPTASDWSQLEQTLEGLLRVDITSPFTDTDRLCPLEAWIIIDLSLETRHCKHRKRVGRVLHAFPMCLIAEALRPWEDLFTSFWTSQTHNYVCLYWADRPVEIDVLSAPLLRFLTTSVPIELPGPAVRAGLHLDGCDIFANDLELLRRILEIPTGVSPQQSFLCESDALGQLSLTFQDFDTSEFNRLADILEDPTIKRVDGLNVMSSMNFEYPSFDRFTAFRRVLHASLRSKAQSVTRDRGISLSIGGNDMLYRQHIEALSDAVRGATRPIRGLAIPEALYHEEAAWLQLYQLLLTPMPTATADFTLSLDTSALDRDAVMLFSCLESLVSEALSEIRRAGPPLHRNVECRVLEAPLSELSARRGDNPVPVSDFCSVLEIDLEGQLLLARPGESPEWVSTRQVVALRIGGQIVVGCSFTALNLDFVLATNPNTFCVLEELVAIDDDDGVY